MVLVLILRSSPFLSYCLVGLVFKASTLRAEDPEFAKAFFRAESYQ